jgi:hypothetical protein
MGDSITGTATESIGYASAVATIDGMYAHAKIVAFVHESTPPCGQRWCSTSYQPVITQIKRMTLHGLDLGLVQLAMQEEKSRVIR